MSEKPADAAVPAATPKPRENQMLRRFTKLGRHFRMAGEYLSTRFVSRSALEIFKDVERFSVFLGYPYSGTSLMGSLLDAHPDAVVAHEMNFLRYFRLGFSRDQIYQLILRNAQATAQEGRFQSGYTYAVPNQWQGRFARIRVVGDKRSSTLLRMVDRHPELLAKFGRKIQVPLKCIHMIRNPFDNITTICLKSRTGRLEDSVEYYFWLVNVLDGVRSRIPKEDFFDLRHETLIADPAGSLRRGCEFLKLEPTDAYLKDCAGIVFPSPRKTRVKVPWSTALVDRVKAGIDKYEFLRGYTYED